MRSAARSPTSTSAQRQPVIVVGAEIADKLFENVDAVGRDVRILGERFTIVGVIQPKGRVLGQSFDGFVLMPLPRSRCCTGAGTRRRSR